MDAAARKSGGHCLWRSNARHIDDESRINWTDADATSVSCGSGND